LFLSRFFPQRRGGAEDERKEIGERVRITYSERFHDVIGGTKLTFFINRKLTRLFVTIVFVSFKAFHLPTAQMDELPTATVPPRAGLLVF